MLSEKIKKLRTEKGLSQEELAIELHVVRQTVSKWEKGLSLPDSNTLIGLAKALDTTVSVLLDETDESKPSPSVSKSSKIMVTILLILGSPIWLSLLIAAASVVLAIYVSAWAVIISLWAVFAAIAVSALYCLVLGLFFMFSGNGFAGIALIGIALICAGFSIFSFLGCFFATKGSCVITKRFSLWLKSRFRKKEEA